MGSQRGSEQWQVLRQSLRLIRPPLAPPTQEGKLFHLDTHLREIIGGFGIADKLRDGTVDGL